VTPEADDVEPVLYVHLAWDGAIFVIRGQTGEQLWTDRQGLHAELERTRELGGTLVYSRERAQEDPPEHLSETFGQMLEYQLPVRLLEQPHPEALVPPERRRTLLQD
jgi:hypothetical protein